MGRFSGVSSARQTAGGVYFREGDYIVKITKVHVVRTRVKGDMFVIETEVVEASGSNCNPVGSKPSSAILMNLDSAMGNINGFVSGVYGVDPADVTEEIVEEVVSDANPMAGTLAMVNATQKAKKSNEEETFTNLVWTKVPTK